MSLLDFTLKEERLLELLDSTFHCEIANGVKVSDFLKLNNPQLYIAIYNALDGQTTETTGEQS